MIKAVIFDCFGVLITDVLDQLLQELWVRDAAKGQHILELIAQANLGMLSRQEFAEQVATTFAMTPDAYRARIASGEAKNTTLFRYIKKLRKRYKTGVLSNVGVDGFWKRFSREEIVNYFDAVVLSGDIGFIKPDAEAYEITADRLGVRVDECVMIDDRERYCEGAKAVGMQAVRYESVEQLRRELEPLLAASV